MTNIARVPGLVLGDSSPARHNPELYYDVQDEDGAVRREFLTHSRGNRRTRRLRQRHHPYFTKTSTKGRAWRSAIADMQRERAKGE